MSEPMFQIFPCLHSTYYRSIVRSVLSGASESINYEMKPAVEVNLFKFMLGDFDRQHKLNRIVVKNNGFYWRERFLPAEEERRCRQNFIIL
jgi:hypothetical protein